ncbi:MAG: hypothetical protein ACRDQF_02450 [Thermocrispum sp.]
MTAAVGPPGLAVGAYRDAGEVPAPGLVNAGRIPGPVLDGRGDAE